MVSHDEPAELQTGPYESFFTYAPELDGAVSVLEIGCGASCAEVAPFAYHGIAKESVVSLVGVACHHDVVDLSAHFAVWAESGGSVYFGSRIYHGMFAEGYRSSQACPFHYFCVLSDVHRSFCHVYYGSLYACAFLNEKIGGITYETAAVAEWLGLSSCGERGEVAAQCLIVEHEEVPYMVEGKRRAGVCHGVALSVASVGYGLVVEQE